jgi:hypothetical protein
MVAVGARFANAPGGVIRLVTRFDRTQVENQQLVSFVRVVLAAHAS